MSITVNGQPIEPADGLTVAALLRRLGIGDDPRGIAVAVDAEVVPRAHWATRHVPAGADVEIVAAVQGG